MTKIIKISLSLLIIFIIFQLYQIVDNKSHTYIIDNIYLNDNLSNKLDYIGYIEIDKLNIKREIVLGINDYNLLTHVTLKKECQNLESDNIILAGHAIKNIFGNLKYIKIGDEIKIISDYTKYYEVTNIDIVDKENINIIDNSNLILITCYDLNKRIIVKAKRIKK